MNKIDNSELDRLIEGAVVENGVRKQLQELESTIRREERKSRIRKRVLWFVGGTVSVAAAVAAVVVLSKGSQSENVEKSIYAQTPADTAELHKPETQSVQSADEPNQVQVISIAEKARSIGKDYLASLDVHRGVDEIEREIQTAMQLLKSGELTEAIDSIEIIKEDILCRKSAINEDDDNGFAELMELNVLEEDIEWYLALAYLSSGDLKNAETKLREITIDGNCHRDEAQKILGELHR